METGTDFHGSVIRVNDEDRSTESASTDLLLFNLQGSDRESGRIFEKKRAREYGGVAQLGEHLPCKQGVMGSNPIISTSRKATRWTNGEPNEKRSVAQVVRAHA